MTSHDDKSPPPADLELSAVLDRFEEAWEADIPPVIQSFLPPAASHHDDSQQQTLLPELIAIDLEHRWRRAGAAHTGAVIQPTNNTADAALPVLPRLEDYLRHYPQLGSMRELPGSLIAHEYRVRQHWGDKPPIAEYRRRLGERYQSVEQGLHEVLSEIATVVLRIYRDQRPTFATRLEGPLELGRQHRDEPPPYAQVLTNAGSRLIIVPHEHTLVSRHHVYLERQDITTVSIINRTTKREVQVNSTRLRAGATCEANLPILIVLADVTVRLETQ